MQSTTMLRANALMTSSRQACNRGAFQAKLAPAAPPRRCVKIIRAEADNTGESITNSGTTKGKDSYEVRVTSFEQYIAML